MSFLWGGKKLLLSTISKKMKPSPTNQRFLQDSAQSPSISFGGKLRCKLQRYRFIERISLFTALKKEVGAGMTVEAAVVLPLFLFFLLNLSCAIELIRLHGNIQLALWQTCSKVSIYGHAMEDSDFAPFFTGLYINNQLIECVGEEYLDNAPVQNGSKGLMLWESDIFSSQDELDVIVTYRVSPWSSYAAFSSFRMANRFYSHIWNGYEIPEDPQGAEKYLDVVYMTENGEVYHENRNCTHLKLSIREVTRPEAESAVNQWGSSYTPCEKCNPGPLSWKLYITEEGDRYHSSLDCPGLKRTVFTVPRSRAAEYPACSRCAR